MTVTNSNVILFPSSATLNELARLGPQEASTLIVADEPPQLESRWLTPEAFIASDEPEQSRRWYCDNETSVYFAARHRDRCPWLAFGQLCLNTLTKLELGHALESIQLPVLHKTPITSYCDDPDYPVVAKPNFGFASCFVKRADSRTDLQNHAARFAREWALSPLASYAMRFFPKSRESELKQLVLERCVTHATVLNAALVVHDRTLVDLHLVFGDVTEATISSDFQWRGFRYSGLVPRELHERSWRIAQSLVTFFNLSSCVAEAELLYDAQSQELYVMEFSPRVIGGSLAVLVEHGTGVNLRQVALKLFFQGQADWSRTRSRDCAIRLRLGDRPTIPANTRPIFWMERNVEGLASTVSEVLYEPAAGS